MGLALKTGLYQAAKDGHDFFGVGGAKRLIERWGERSPHEDYGRIDPKTGREAGVIPMTLQKLARMHRKDAKVEPLYPGNRKVSQGVFAEDFLDRSSADSQPPLPFGVGAMPVSRGAHSFFTRNKIDGVELARTDAGEPVYVLKIKKPGYEISEYLTGSGAAHPLTKLDYQAKKDVFNNNLLQFKTREAAEDAMRQINKSKAENFREINNPENLRAAFGADDPVGEPFNAIRIDDDLRESILNRGFPMFAAGDERAALMAGAFASQEGLTPEAALVPGDVTGKTMDILKQHGIENIEGYDGSREGRAEALKKFKGLMFSQGEPEAAFAASQGDEDEKPSNAEGLASRLMRLWDRK